MKRPQIIMKINDTIRVCDVLSTYQQLHISEFGVSGCAIYMCDLFNVIYIRKFDANRK